MEFLIVIGIMILLILPLLAIYFQAQDRMERDITISQVTQIANKVGDVAEEIYYLGDGSKRTFRVYFPDNINNITFQNNNINFNLKGSYGDVNRHLVMNITGNLSNYQGIHIIKIYADGNNIVITDEDIG